MNEGYSASVHGKDVEYKGYRITTELTRNGWNATVHMKDGETYITGGWVLEHSAITYAKRYIDTLVGEG